MLQDTMIHPILHSLAGRRQTKHGNFLKSDDSHPTPKQTAGNACQPSASKIHTTQTFPEHISQQRPITEPRRLIIGRLLHSLPCQKSWKLLIHTNPCLSIPCHLKTPTLPLSTKTTYHIAAITSQSHHRPHNSPNLLSKYLIKMIYAF